MEFHSFHKTLHPNHLGGLEEKQQMLSLNRRLETYLNRVKLLEEENALLAREIQAARRHGQGAHSHRRGLEEELRRARLAVDAAWRDRFLAELEVGKLAEELQALDEQRQREAQAKSRAKTKLEQSRKELEEEHRAQIWLRGRVGQLEHEMRLLVQSHQEDVARFQATLTHSRASAPQRVNQHPELLQLGEEYSQRAARAWQEAAEAHRGQMARLEESLEQARGRLTQVGQEKRESQLKLQALEKEMASAQDVRRHLEKTAGQQRDVHSQEIQQLQEHLEGLEAEKGELGQQIDHLVLENRGLLQLKMSLGLEVATYRALLDGEGFRGDVPLDQRKHVSLSDAAFSSRGVKTIYPAQLSASHKTSSFSSARCKTEPTSSTPIGSRKPAAWGETPKISGKSAEAAKPAAEETPRLKTQQGGSVEGYRPQEVQEKVTPHTEALPPGEEKEVVETATSEKEEHGNSVAPPEETPFEESVVKHQVEFGLGSEPLLNDEVGHKAPSFVPSSVKTTKESCDFSGSNTNEEEDVQQGQKQAPVEAWVREEGGRDDAANDQGDDSDSETDALLEPTWESRPSTPDSESDTEDIVTEFNLDENVSSGDVVGKKTEMRSSVLGTKDGEDKLYPDGEEMDTWDSVIERKVDLKMSRAVKADAGKGQHAEPEEDISAKEPEGRKKESTQECESDAKQVDNMASEQVGTKIVDDEQQTVIEREDPPLPGDDEDEDEDSQNISVSWRTELEGDSYAQDNTLADTRPLIRYKSDETDANTLASHLDESESSEGEQDRKETGTGTWSQDKSKRFGTMEDLCEEVEGQIIDEEYHLEYTHSEDTGAGYGPGEREQRVGEAEETVRKPNEEHSDEGTEKLFKPEQVLETGRLVEQKLETRITESFSAQFAEQQVSEETLHLMDETMKEHVKQEEAGETKTENVCEQTINQDLRPSTMVSNPMSENPFYTDYSVVMSQEDTMAQWDILDQEGAETKEERKEDEAHDVSMVNQADPTDQPIVSQSDSQEVNIPEDPQSALQVPAGDKNVKDVAENTEAKEAEDVDASKQSEKDETSQEVYLQLRHVDDPRGESEESQEQTGSEIVGFQDLSDSLRHHQPDEVQEAFKEPQETVGEGVAQSQELPVSLQHAQSESPIQTTEGPREHLAEGVAGCPDPSRSLEQPQLDAVLKDFKEAQEEVRDVADSHEFSSKQQQLQGDGRLEPFQEFQDHPGEEVADIHEPFSSLKHTQLESSMQAIEQSQEQMVDDVTRCQELSGSLQLSKLDDAVEASKETLEQLVGDVVECQELPVSIQPPGLTEVSKKSQEEGVEGIEHSQELSGDLEQPQRDVPLETLDYFQELSTEDDAKLQEFPEASERAEWEVLENPGEEFEIQDRRDQKRGLLMGSSTESQEKPLDISPGSGPAEHDIFAMQDATDSGLGSFFPPGVKNDFWVSSLEGGATFQPEDARNEAREQTNQNVGFTDEAVWGISEQQNVVNGNSAVDAGSLEAKTARKQMQAEVKRVVCRNVLGAELVHSEESEVEGESWSSEE